MPADKAIDAVAVLDFTATAPLERLVVELDTLLTISSVQVDGAEVRRRPLVQPGGSSHVALPRPLAVGQKTSLRIAYAGKPRVAPRAPWDGGFVWSTAPTGEPWIATAVQGEGCDIFWPCIDSPHGEPGRVDLHITVPSDLSAPSNGRFLGKVDHGDGWTTWNWSAKSPNTYAIALNVGPYEEVTGEYRSRFGNTIPMRYWHLKSDTPEQVQALFAQFPQDAGLLRGQRRPLSVRRREDGRGRDPASGHGAPDHQRLWQRLQDRRSGLRLAVAARVRARMVRQPADQSERRRYVAARRAGQLYAAALCALAAGRPLYAARTGQSARGADQQISGRLGHAQDRGRGLQGRQRAGQRHLFQGFADQPFAADADRGRRLPRGDHAAGLWAARSPAGQFRAPVSLDRRLPADRQCR